MVVYAPVDVGVFEFQAEGLNSPSLSWLNCTVCEGDCPLVLQDLRGMSCVHKYLRSPSFRKATLNKQLLEHCSNAGVSNHINHHFDQGSKLKDLGDVASQIISLPIGHTFESPFGWKAGRFEAGKGAVQEFVNGWLSVHIVVCVVYVVYQYTYTPDIS